MNPRTTFVKTTAGAAEVRKRAGGIAQRLRSLLILVDGSRDAAWLAAAASQIGAPEDALDSLLAAGLIAPDGDEAIVEQEAAPPGAGSGELPPEDEEALFRQARKHMNDAIVDALGLRALFFTLKLEKCATRSDLRETWPDFVRLLGKVQPQDKALRIEAVARRLLS